MEWAGYKARNVINGGWKPDSFQGLSVLLYHFLSTNSCTTLSFTELGDGFDEI